MKAAVGVYPSCIYTRHRCAPFARRGHTMCCHIYTRLAYVSVASYIFVPKVVRGPQQTRIMKCMIPMPFWGAMLIRVGFHLTSSFNHFAGAGLVPVRNQCVSIDKSDALAIRVADGHRARPAHLIEFF